MPGRTALETLTAGILALALLGGLASSAGPEAQSCPACASRGIVACSKCAKKGCTGKTPTTFCSAALACSGCEGTRLVECGKCSAEPEIDLGARRAEIVKRGAELAEVDRYLDRPLLHGETAHFVLTWDVPRVDVKGGETAHGALHVYLDRMEEFFERCRLDLGAEEQDFRSKMRGFVWSRAKEQERASTKWTLQSSTTESKLLGQAPVFSIFYDKSHLHEEYELHQAIVHHLAHCLFSNVWDGIWIGNIKGGWMDEGLAHWYENALFDGVRHYCYVETDTLFDFKFGHWEAEVRGGVDDPDTPGLLGVTGLNTTEMTPEQHMFAWSICDYLLRAHPGAFGKIGRLLKQQTPVSDALKSVLGTNVFEFDANWRAWVRENYSLKPKR